MIKQELTYDKESGEITDYKEYYNNTIIIHQYINENINQISDTTKLYENDEILLEETISINKKTNIKTHKTFSYGEIITYTKYNRNGMCIFELEDSYAHQNNGIFILEFEHEELSKKYTSFGYHIHFQHLKSRFIRFQAIQNINGKTYNIYGNIIPLTKEQCTQLCTWSEDFKTKITEKPKRNYTIVPLIKNQLNYIQTEIYKNEKLYEYEPEYF